MLGIIPYFLMLKILLNFGLLFFKIALTYSLTMLYIKNNTSWSHVPRLFSCPLLFVIITHWVLLVLLRGCSLVLLRLPQTQWVLDCDGHVTSWRRYFTARLPSSSSYILRCSMSLLTSRIKTCAHSCICFVLLGNHCPFYIYLINTSLVFVKVVYTI